MKPYRVTIQFKSGEHTTLISTTVPAYSKDQAIEKISCGVAGEVVTKKAELLNPAVNCFQIIHL